MCFLPRLKGSHGFPLVWQPGRQCQEHIERWERHQDHQQKHPGEDSSVHVSLSSLPENDRARTVYGPLCTLQTPEDRTSLHSLLSPYIAGIVPAVSVRNAMRQSTVTQHGVRSTVTLMLHRCNGPAAQGPQQYHSHPGTVNHQSDRSRDDRQRYQACEPPLVVPTVASVDSCSCHV